MNLIKEIEISYFRSFYKANLRHCNDMNIIFGKNDVGKSNIVRALNLFFNNVPDNISDFDFDIDFSDIRLEESVKSDDIRKFIYVKITFNTPKNFQRSLGTEFYVKRQWTVSRGNEFIEEFSSSVSKQKHIAKRFLNQIRFIAIPAIKDISIFEKLLNDVHDTLAKSSSFNDAVEEFTKNVQSSTKDLFSTLPSEVAFETKISRPGRMDELFQTLDFETKTSNDSKPKFLTIQRGDGIKARHIPELLNFISRNDDYRYHIWGFEEPENSLDFVSAEAEARRLQAISGKEPVQIFITTHSPSFYNLSEKNIERYYISRSAEKGVIVIQGKELEKYDIGQSIKEGFYLPAVAKALEEFSEQQRVVENYKGEIIQLSKEIEEAKQPVLLTEGKTDVLILNKAWEALYHGKCPFIIKSCDTSADGKKGGAAGADKLSMCIKSVGADSQNIVMGLFDRDEAGIKGWGLDRNFGLADFSEEVKVSTNKRAFGIVLPIPESRTECAEHKNLPIEYMFEDKYLTTKILGKSLRTKAMKISKQIGNRNISIEINGGYEVIKIAKCSLQQQL